MMSEGAVKNMNTYEVVTQRVIDAIENTKSLPWRRPWRTHNLKGALPTNLSSKKQYHGVNVFLLSMMGFQSPYWLTFKQAKALGGSVRKGEKGTPVVYWSILEKKNAETSTQWFLIWSNAKE
ncbi:MAG TPA: ArdC family protein [Oligoflexia bacterium]|nr:ArdC family protein [Oligoflexia bacterium]